MTTEEKAKAYDEAVEQIKKLLGEEGTVIGRHWLEKFFPELAESEDERIRKELWEYFHNLQLTSDCEFSPSLTIDDVLAYLEKQKEQKTKEPGYKHEDYFCERCQANAFEEGRKAGMKEQKPAKWSEEDEAFLKVAIAICNRYSHKDIADWLESLRPQPKEDIDAIAKREYERGKLDGYWEGYKKAQENMSFHYNLTSPSIGRSCLEGGPCTNPQMDCINCPKRNSSGTYITLPNTASGESKLESHWRPTEEQMIALKKSIRYLEEYGRNDDDLVLNSLYNDLRKLM